MVFDPGLIQGVTLSNRELCSVFKCSTQGGISITSDGTNWFATDYCLSADDWTSTGIV